MKKQIVAGDNHHYIQKKMSRSSRARNQEGTKAAMITKVRI